MKNPGVHRTGFEPMTVALRKLHTDALTIRPQRRRSTINTPVIYIYLRGLSQITLAHEGGHSGQNFVPGGISAMG